MTQLGQINTLTIVKQVDFGVYLDGDNLGEILMPKRYVDPDLKPGDQVTVMVYLDGEERYVATTEEPLAQVGDFAWLKVNKIENAGAFLDWGLSKELLVPFSEQKIKMEEGRSYLVYVYIDKVTDRIAASMKLEKFFTDGTPPFVKNEPVDIIVWTPTEIGYKAIVNGKYQGVLYKNEVFKKLSTGQKMKAFIKKVRGGSLPYNDKTDPEVIYRIFGISKKAFKQSIGNLFKQRIITISETGIELVK